MFIKIGVYTHTLNRIWGKKQKSKCEGLPEDVSLARYNVRV